MSEKSEFERIDEIVFIEQKAKIRKLEDRFTAPIVCMCGSTRFKQAWIAENARLTGEGNIVLAVGLWGHHERVFPDAATKAKLDDLHKRKIDLCDWVWVLDVGGYIGDSTRSEIAYAEKLSRPVRYLSKEFPGYVEPVDPLIEAQGEVERLANEADMFHDAKDAAETRLAALEGALISKTINTCELITKGLAKGLGYPERIKGKCEGYTCGPNDDEPHDWCKTCIAAYDDEAEYKASLTPNTTPTACPECERLRGAAKEDMQACYWYQKGWRNATTGECMQACACHHGKTCAAIDPIPATGRQRLWEWTP